MTWSLLRTSIISLTRRLYPPNNIPVSFSNACHCSSSKYHNSGQMFVFLYRKFTRPHREIHMTPNFALHQWYLENCQCGLTSNKPYHNRWLSLGVDSQNKYDTHGTWLAYIVKSNYLQIAQLGSGIFLLHLQEIIYAKQLLKNRFRLTLTHFSYWHTDCRFNNYI